MFTFQRHTYIEGKKKTTYTEHFVRRLFTHNHVLANICSTRAYCTLSSAVFFSFFFINIPRRADKPIDKLRLHTCINCDHLSSCCDFRKSFGTRFFFFFVSCQTRCYLHCRFCWNSVGASRKTTRHYPSIIKSIFCPNVSLEWLV